MGTTFTEFVKTKALQDRLPFGVDFQFNLVESDLTEEVAGYKIALQNDLTVGESWFMELIQDFNQANASEFRILVRVLADKLKKTMDLESIEEASKYLVTGNDDWKDSDAYLAFCVENQPDLDRLLSLFRLVNNDVGTDMLLITFFMKCRSDLEWSLGKTASLPIKAMKSIKELLVREANGGNEPEPVEDDDDDAEEESPKGK